MEWLFQHWTTKPGLMKEAVLILVAMLIAACAGTTKYHEYPGIDSYGRDTAMINIVRKSSGFGAGVGAPINVDGHLLGRVGLGGTLTFQIPAKAVSISTSTGSITLNAQSGLDYIYEVFLPINVHLTTPPFKIRVISENRAKELGFD